MNQKKLVNFFKAIPWEEAKETREELALWYQIEDQMMQEIKTKEAGTLFWESLWDSGSDEWKTEFVSLELNLP